MDTQARRDKNHNRYKMLNGYIFYINNIFQILTKKNFKGWGRKRTGRFALWCHETFGGNLTLLEDGFIRSLDLGVKGSTSFSIVEDDIGIYYDATAHSRLEHILQTYDFDSDVALMSKARDAIELIKKYHISKYNHAEDVDKNFFLSDEKRVLIIAQTARDSSLEYGLGNSFTTDEMIKKAIEENPDCKIYLKIHPDVLSGKKSSDIDIKNIDKNISIISEDINPISLLKCFSKVYTKTSQMGFEALLMGKECVCFGMPFYAGWGLTYDRVQCDRRKRKLTIEQVFAAAYILYTRYYNPYSQKSSNVIDTIQTIVKYRAIDFSNRGRLFFFGFSRWKRAFMKPYFNAKNNQILFCNTLSDALKFGFCDQDRAFVWGMKDINGLNEYCKEHTIAISKVEDGFIRSVWLGSDLTQPYSLIVDQKGIYFDPRQPSDLEDILSTYDFDDKIKERAQKLINKIVTSKFSKYNGFEHTKLLIHAKEGQKIILIPGQVEDDASMIYGGYGISTIKLLQDVRYKNPKAYIIYKPHPDVLSGNRKGLMDKQIAMKYADQMIENVSIDSVLELCHEVHTITSTVGFDALLRGKKVYVYGMPFYAGWGLTVDKFMSDRNDRKLELEELVAGALIVYPRYISPKTHKLCEVEVAFDEMIELQQKYFESFWYRNFVDFKTLVLRRIRRFVEYILEKLRSNKC